MKIFVTGATGFIGRAFCRVALDRGHQLLALCRTVDQVLAKEIRIAHGTMADIPWGQVEHFAPDAVLHLAWTATPGDNLTSPENEMWLEWSKASFRRLREMGVAHIAGTGTCIEYASSHAPLNEESSPLGPVFPYSCAKTALFEWLRDSSSADGSALWTWFRVFYAYGPGEHPGRLGTSLIHQLRQGRSLALRTPHSVKDYIFIDDVALALCQAMEARLTGAVNVGTGNGISIQSLARRIAELLPAYPSLVQQAAQLSSDPTPVVIADCHRLCGIGWRPHTSLATGLQRLIDSLSAPTQ